jgi:hypothetical protein
MPQVLFIEATHGKAFRTLKRLIVSFPISRSIHE